MTGLDNELRARLETLARDREYVSLDRDPDVDPVSVTGFVEQISDELVLIQYVNDFFVDGFMVMRTRDVVGVRQEETEQFFERMMEAEGVTRSRAPTPQSDLDDWPSLFMWLARRTGAVIIECETLPEPEFYLGRIVTATRDALVLREVHVDGVLEEEVTRLTYDDITFVRFNDRYSMFFGRHAWGAPRH